jgi:hypothetical protein
VFNDDLYFGAPDGFVYKVGGASDSGDYITYECTQAFNYLGNPHQKKQLATVMPITNFNYPTYFAISAYYDFSVDRPLPNYEAPPEPENSEWNIAEWDVAKWLSETPEANPVRRNINGMGYAFALVLRFKARAQTVTWWSNHLWFKPAGIV